MPRCSARRFKTGRTPCRFRVGISARCSGAATAAAAGGVEERPTITVPAVAPKAPTRRNGHGDPLVSIRFMELPYFSAGRLLAGNHPGSPAFNTAREHFGLNEA